MRFDNDEVELNGLSQLMKALGDKNAPHIEIGVINDNPRGKGPSNAQIGAAHEYGAPARNLPSRSWLRMPLKDHLQEKMESDGLLSESTTKEVIKLGSVLPWMKQVSISALATVKEAFATDGYGTWAEWITPGYTSQTGQILDDTGKLKNSVDSKVVS